MASLYLHNLTQKNLPTAKRRTTSFGAPYFLLFLFYFTCFLCGILMLHQMFSGNKNKDEMSTKQHFFYLAQLSPFLKFKSISHSKLNFVKSHIGIFRKTNKKVVLPNFRFNITPYITKFMCDKVLSQNTVTFSMNQFKSF